MAPNTEVTFYACARKQSHHEVVTEKSVSAVCITLKSVVENAFLCQLGLDTRLLWCLGGSLFPVFPLDVNWAKGYDENFCLDVYKARHAHKRLYTVLPKYSKIQVLPGVTSCRLMKHNKQAIELNSLLINNMPKDGYGCN